MLLRLLPLLIFIIYPMAMWLLSAWRTKQQLAASSTPLQHPLLVPMLKRLGAAMDLPPVKAHIFEVEQINGLAAPDGNIYLTRGFIRQLDAGTVTPEELASVIAHELGHVAHDHSRRRLVDFAGQNLIITLMMGMFGRYLPFIGPRIIQLLVRLVAARLSRDSEYEADAFAAALMVKAGLGTAPQISLFEKLERLSGSNANRGTAWLLSHPKTDRRIAAIKALEARWATATDGPTP